MRLMIIDDTWKALRMTRDITDSPHADLRNMSLMDYVIEDCGCGRYKALKDRSGLLEGYFGLPELFQVIIGNRINHI